MRQKLPKQDNVQLLVNTAMAWAEEELQKEGKISAAAAWLVQGATQPEFRPAGPPAAGKAVTVQEQEAALAAELRAPWQQGELAAVLLLAPVLFGKKGSRERAEAVRLHVEAGGGYCADILMPYRVRTRGRWRGKPGNRVHFSQPVAQESDSRFSDPPAPH